MPNLYALEGFEDKTASAATLTPGACTGSIMEVFQDKNGGKEKVANMWMTDGGFAMAQIFPGPGYHHTVVAVPAAPITAADVAGDYAGIYFTSPVGSTTNDVADVMAVKLVLDANGIGKGQSYDDVATSTMGQGSVNIALQAGLSDGWLIGSIHDGAASGNIACAAAADVGDKDMLFCVGQHPNDNSRPFTVMAVSE